MTVNYYSQWFSCGACLISFLGGLFLGEDIFVLGWELIRFSSRSLSVEVLVDQVGLLFIGVVFLISHCVLKFRGFYMQGEVYGSRFHCLLMCFVFSMALFIFIPNLFGLMVGWDGLGVFSFLLIIFYPASSSLSAGLLTALTNRLGDCFLVLLVMFSRLGLGRSRCLGERMGTLGFLLALGAITKRAQYPFSSWLPQAIAAPTPVSSLVHSSTLVTAGVFLVVRYFGGLREGVLGLLQWSSLITLVISGVAACLEYDLKKVVALSTLSQVSLMMLAVRIGFPHLAFFHLVAHAVTKALLFICVGLVIKGHGQDLRRLSPCFKEASRVKWYFIGRCASLCGLPFFRGYYSKELVLERIFFSELRVLGSGFFLGGVFCTRYYRARLAYYCFFAGLGAETLGGSKGLRYGGCRLPEVHSFCFPLFFLSLIIGGLGSWYAFSSPPLYPCGLMKVFVLSIPWLGIWWMGVVEIPFHLFGGGISQASVNEAGESRRAFFRELGFLDGLSRQPLVSRGLGLSEEARIWLEQGWLEYFGPGGISSLIKKFLLSNISISGHWFNIFFLGYLAQVFFLLAFF